MFEVMIVYLSVIKKSIGGGKRKINFYTLKTIKKSARKFKTPPGVRLSGTVGEKRITAEDEIQSLKESLGLLGRFLKVGPGGMNIKYVRDIHFDSAKPVLVGKLTKGLF